MKVQGENILVTGANRGIGKAFVDEFLKAGAAKIYLGIRRLETVIGYVAHAPKKLIPLQLDVTNMAHIRAAAEKAGDVSVLVNNAGVLHGGKLTDKRRLKAARHEMEVNYFGPLRMMHEFAPILARNGGGVVVNISSVAGLVAMPGLPTYSASKVALHFLTLEARMELAEQGTQVIGVYPGPVDTAMARTLDMPKLTPVRVARETIYGIEQNELSVFPDPHMRNIYETLQKGGDITKKKLGNRPPEAKAA